MLQLFFAVAFSAVPLALYIPPVRYLSRFVRTMEEIWGETSAHTPRVYPIWRYATTGIFNCLLCGSS